MKNQDKKLNKELLELWHLYAIKNNQTLACVQLKSKLEFQEFLTEHALTTNWCKQYLPKVNRIIEELKRLKPYTIINSWNIEYEDKITVVHEQDEMLSVLSEVVKNIYKKPNEDKENILNLWKIYVNKHPTWCFVFEGIESFQEICDSLTESKDEIPLDSKLYEDIKNKIKELRKLEPHTVIKKINSAKDEIMIIYEQDEMFTVLKTILNK